MFSLQAWQSYLKEGNEKLKHPSLLIKILISEDIEQSLLIKPVPTVLFLPLQLMINLMIFFSMLFLIIGSMALD